MPGAVAQSARGLDSLDRHIIQDHLQNGARMRRERHRHNLGARSVKGTNPI
nr:MAG TPA: hypothetical protein [Caudoviricetes sp.]